MSTENKIAKDVVDAAVKVHMKFQERGVKKG